MGDPILIFAFGTGALLGTGLAFTRFGAIVFARLVFPAVMVLGLVVAISHAAVPGIDFDLSVHLPWIRAIEERVFYAFLAGLIVGMLLRWSVSLVRDTASSERKGRSPRWRSSAELYFETAIRLGVLTATSDRDPSPCEFRALESAIDLSFLQKGRARRLYDQQIRAPKPMSSVLRPFVRRFGPGSAVAETLIFTMAKVAAADGVNTASELGLVRMAAATLGLSAADADRVIATAEVGRAPDGVDACRIYHLAMLGLAGDADRPDIEAAWRRLDARYAPIALAQSDLPTEEMETADALHQTLDASYAWLKAHT
ncbi:MAG: TerB family tellurite resistance protein [Pseudomonadota bacterium]